MSTPPTGAGVVSGSRAGVLEWGTVETLRRHGLGARMDAEGTPKDTINIAWKGSELLAIDTQELLGRRMMVYGQTMIQEDLYAASDEAGTDIVFEAEDVAIHDVDTDSPWVTYRHAGEEIRIDCDYIAGCDGFHGPVSTGRRLTLNSKKSWGPRREPVSPRNTCASSIWRPPREPS